MTFILQSKEWQKFSRIWLDIAFACLLTVLSGFSPSTLAAPGDLDMSFGGSGKVTTNSPMTAVAQSLLLQPDGKFVAAGFASSGGLMKFALARFLPGGSLDTGFGTGGLLNTTFGSLESWINAMALQADGKIICAGAVSAGSNWGIALARYHSDGTLDTTFGTGGLVTTAIGGSSAANAVAVRPDGKILVAGWGYGGAGQFVLLRYNQDGSLDTSFGSGGIVLTAVGSAASASSMVIQPDGKIVLGGVRLRWCK
jgi:uncharacterized delta-60 repeat protein